MLRHSLLLLLLLAASAVPAKAQKHPQVTDPALAPKLKQKYLALTGDWVKNATFTAAEQAAMREGRKWESVMAAGPDDPLAKKILAAGEPGFDAIASFYPGKVLDRTVLGSYSDPRRPMGEYNDEFVIWWNGAISADLFKGPLTDRLGSTGIQPLACNTVVLFRVGRDGEMYGSRGDRFSRIGYEDGYLPIVTSVYEHDGFRFRQIALADQPAGQTAGWDIAFVRFEVTNLGRTASTAELSADITLVDGTPLKADGQRVLNARGAVIVAHSDPGARFDPATGRLRFQLEIAPGKTESVVLKIPYVPDSQPLVGPVSVEEFASAHKRVREFWLRLMDAGADIRTPEPRVNDVWRALLLQNFVLADGPRFTYGAGLRYNDSTYPQESNFGAHTFAMYGHKDYADALQPYFVPMSVTHEGAGRKYQNRRAMVLHHLLENYRLTGKTDVFERFKDDFYRVADEIIADRRSTMTEEKGVRPLHWGLLPPDKPGADVQASTQTVYVLGHNVTNAQGLLDFGTFLVRTGIDPQRGERYIREAREFRETLLRAMEKAAIRLPDRPPFIDLQTLYFRQTPDYGPDPYDDLGRGRLQGSYYHYWVDMNFHYNFFNPDDAVARWMADYLQQRNGFALGLTRASRSWNPSPYGWVNNVYDGGYYNFRLRRGEIGEFLMGFYGKLALAMSRHVYVQSEGQPLIGFNTKDGGFVDADLSLPNSAANADFLLMLRNMLVYEELKDNIETGTLYILRGAPRRWFEDGKKIEVRKLATYFGDLAFSVESKLKEGRIAATLRLPASAPMKSLAVSFRHPQGALIRSVKVNGQPVTDFDAQSGLVRMPARPGVLEIEVDY